MLTLKKALQSTYKSKEKSEMDLKEHGYNFDKELSNINDRVYYNPKDDKLLVSYRGTHNWLNDISTDLAVLTGNLKNTDRYKHSKDTYDKAKTKYNKDSATVVGHSLGGSIASAVGSGKDEVYTYNKGVGLPILGKTKHNPNENAYRHHTDVISGLSAVDGNQQSFGNISTNSLTAHSTDQLDKIGPIYV